MTLIFTDQKLPGDLVLGTDVTGTWPGGAKYKFLVMRETCGLCGRWGVPLIKGECPDCCG